MPNRDIVALLEVVRARTQRALAIVQETTLEEFLEDTDTQDIAFACISDIAEALRRIRNDHEVYVEHITDLRDIVDSRNHMSHELFTRDYERFWYDMVDGLPLLGEETRRLINRVT